MKKVVGLWVDHRKAIIVMLVGTGKEIVLTMQSQMEPQLGFTGKSSEQFLEATAEDRRDRRFEQHLNVYYDEVIAQLREAEEILVFGPGEAKGELEKRLESRGLGNRVVGVETNDKMTKPQIVAKVRQRFLG